MIKRVYFDTTYFLVKVPILLVNKGVTGSFQSLLVLSSVLLRQKLSKYKI